MKLFSVNEQMSVDAKKERKKNAILIPFNTDPCLHPICMCNL